MARRVDGSRDGVDRRRFLATLGAGAAAALCGRHAARAADRPPNVVFILADDLGWRDTSLYGSTFCETPNLVRLAARGVRFTQAYAANPLCSPTRASILTGLWPARIGITTPSCHLKEERFQPTVPDKAAEHLRAVGPVSATRLKHEYVTIAETLRAAGYRTGHFGKWHLGWEPYDPLHQGFDVDVPHTAGPGPAGSYVAPWKFPEELHFTGQPGEHVEDRMAQEAVRFLRENRDRPFFLNYWCFSVHSPWDAKPALIEKYARKMDPASGQRNPVYGAMVESLDDAIGTLLDTIDELGLADNTIIVFFSDNGGYAWPGRQQLYSEIPITSNAPLRGGKATLYEGGTREPCVIVWPGVVPPRTVNDTVIQSIDFHPTILEMLGLQAPAGQTFDGQSLVPLLRGGRLDRDAIYCYFPHAMGEQIGTLPGVWVRQGDWKLIRFFFDGPGGRHRYELYNLRDDLSEERNLADQMPAKVQELDARIEDFLRRTNPVLPKPNPAYNPGAKLLEGWRLVRGATATFEAGRLILEAPGGLITLACFTMPEATGPVQLEARLKSSGGGPVQAFWAVPGEGSFKGERAVKMDLPHDGEWHTARVTLPCPGKLGGVRFDPGNAKGRYEIDWLRLSDATGKLLREWSFGG